MCIFFYSLGINYWSPWARETGRKPTCTLTSLLHWPCIFLHFDFFFFNSEQFLSFLWNICLFIWLHQISAVASRIFSCGMWTVNPWLWLVGFSSLTRDQTWAPCIGSVWNLSHWTTGEVPTWTMFQSKFGVQKLLIESLVFLESETFLRI